MDSDYIGLIIIGAFALVVGGLTFYSLHLSANVKRSMLCFSSKTQETFLKLQSTFDAEGIKYSLMLWTQSQIAHANIGMARNAPKEIWVRKEDIERARLIVEANFKFEVTPHAVVVE